MIAEFNQLTPDSIFLEANKRIIFKTGANPPNISFQSSANGGIIEAPITLSSTETQQGYTLDKNIYSEVLPVNNTRIDGITSEIITQNLSTSHTAGIYAFGSKIRYNNSSSSVSDGSNYFARVEVTNSGTPGDLTRVFGYTAQAAISGAGRNITDIGGVYIRDFGQDFGTNTIANSYGVLIQNQTTSAANTYAIKTGTGLVDFGDNLKLSTYGAGNKSATDLSKTGSGYLSEYATDGTLLESDLTKEQIQYNYQFTPFAYNAVDAILVDTLLQNRFPVNSALDGKSVTAVEYITDSNVTTNNTLVRLLEFDPDTDTYTAFGSAIISIDNNSVEVTTNQALTAGRVIYCEVSQSGDNVSGLTVFLKIE